MKKNIMINFLLILFLIILFFNKSLLIKGTFLGSKLFIENILPTILPMYIITQLLINYNLPYYIAKLFHNNLYVFILIMAIIAGTPNNAVIIKELLNNQEINIEQANSYLKYSFFSNPLFLFTILRKTFSLKYTFMIIVSHYLANIILYCLHPTYIYNINKIKVNSFNDTIIKAINNSSLLLLNIYITIIMFNIIIALLPHYLDIYKGLIELTYGLNNIKYLALNELNKAYLATILISFGGLSIHMQIKSVINNTKLNYQAFFKGRLEQVFISLIILTISITINIVKF
jgi:hypothetical protein